jgi:hypothetical protein
MTGSLIAGHSCVWALEAAAATALVAPTSPFRTLTKAISAAEIAQLEQRSMEDIARTWHPSRASTKADLGLSRESCSH